MSSVTLLDATWLARIGLTTVVPSQLQGRLSLEPRFTGLKPWVQARLSRFWPQERYTNPAVRYWCPFCVDPAACRTPTPQLLLLVSLLIDVVRSNGMADLICWIRNQRSMDSHKESIAIDDIKCRRDKMGGRWPVLFSSHAARSVHVLAAVRSRRAGSLCRFCKHLCHITTEATQARSSFTLECGFLRSLICRQHLGE